MKTKTIQKQKKANKPAMANQEAKAQPANQAASAPAAQPSTCSPTCCS